MRSPGMSIVAAALLMATFIKVAAVLPRRGRPWLFAILAFAAVGIMRWPLFWVMGILVPLALIAAWKEKE
jgi:chromate transporter